MNALPTELMDGQKKNYPQCYYMRPYAGTNLDRYSDVTRTIFVRLDTAASVFPGGVVCPLRDWATFTGNTAYARIRCIFLELFCG